MDVIDVDRGVNWHVPHRTVVFVQRTGPEMEPSVGCSGQGARASPRAAAASQRARPGARPLRSCSHICHSMQAEQYNCDVWS